MTDSWPPTRRLSGRERTCSTRRSTAKDTETLEPYLKMSYEYVTSLKPKPTTKPKKKQKKK